MRGPDKFLQIMGILNVTPDSFSGDGVLGQKDYIAAAVTMAERMIAEGADILDIGGESSRPGALPVSAEEEICRVVPVIEAIVKNLRQRRNETGRILPPLRGELEGGSRRNTDAGLNATSPHPTSPVKGEEHHRSGGERSLQISIDTTKATVAEAAINAGATIINDISALGDPAMAEVAVKTGATVVLMDNRSEASAITQDHKIGSEYKATVSGDIVEDVKNHLAARAAFAEKSGIARDKIILDPGLGFGKTVEQNLLLIREVGRIKALGYPVMLGFSRKSFIGRALDLPVEQRLEGTAALTALGVFLGADILRVHDVEFMARTAKMALLLKQ